jgi:hypothetical protein
MADHMLLHDSNTKNLHFGLLLEIILLVLGTIILQINRGSV